ncbi:MAG: SH3 domain-containing protein [Leptolyngbyaceae cyanobacterium SU_3_3]|nr:SH3 domain-containing protein [Leptolyngbyaceae cyanobacterium SU_3_3]
MADKTESALVAFQRDRGLSADGIVGSATASALGVASSGSGNSTGGGGTPTGTVTVSAGSGVNIRSGPGTNYAIVGGLGNGARVSTFGSSNGWLRVNGGWISSSFTSGGRRWLVVVGRWRRAQWHCDGSTCDRSTHSQRPWNQLCDRRWIERWRKSEHLWLFKRLVSRQWRLDFKFLRAVD